MSLLAQGDHILSAAIICEHYKSRTIVLVGLILIPESDRLPEVYKPVVGWSGLEDFRRPDQINFDAQWYQQSAAFGRMTPTVVVLAKDWLEKYLARGLFTLSSHGFIAHQRTLVSGDDSLSLVRSDRGCLGMVV